jgi:Uma2 family endonuclease
MSSQNSLANENLSSASAAPFSLLEAPGAAPETIPPLENGDHLTRDEFERRYNAMPHATRAELIEGIVYMPAALRWDQHGKPHFRLIAWLGVYEAETPGTAGGDNSTIRLDLDNEPQPDVLFMIDPDRGGQAIIDEDGYVSRAPELIAEVAASSVSIDTHKKLHAYLRNGVREYIVWRVLDREIDWFVLRGGKFESLSVNERGLLCSEVFPGLWLDGQALIRGDLQKVHAVLDEGLATSAHAAFVARLEAAKKPS